MKPAPRLADRLVRYRVGLLLGATLLTLLAWNPARRLSFDQSVESLYAEDDPWFDAWRASKKWFGGDEFALVAWREAELFDTNGALRPSAAEEIRAFAAELNAIPGVDNARSQHLAKIYGSPVLTVFPGWRDQVRRVADSVLVGPDGKSTAILLQFEARSLAEVSRDRTITEIRTAARRHDPPAFVVGEPVQIHDMFQYVERDGATLSRWSLGVLSLVLLLVFRSIRWVLLPLLMVVAAILWTRAGLEVSGLQLSMVSSMLNSLVTIITIATVMHITVHYRELLPTTGGERIEAFRRTLSDLLPPIFWSCSTTGVGFAALMSSRISPVRSFGMMMSLASLLVLAAVAAFAPGGGLLGSLDTHPRAIPGERHLFRFLDRLVSWIDGHPRSVAGLVAAMVIPGLWGLSRLEIETDFSTNFRPDTPIVQSLDFVESELGGAGIWEVNFFAPPELTPEYLAFVEQLTGELRDLAEKEPHLTKVDSLTDYLALIPGGSFVPAALRLQALDQYNPDVRRGFYQAEAGRMRIVLRAHERQGAVQRERLIHQVEQVAQERFGVYCGEHPEQCPPAPEPPVATGMFVLLTHLIESLMRDQWVSFLLAAGAISAMLMLAFGSIRLGLIALLPNLFPIVVVVGGMGLLEAKVTIATAMISSVSLGLTVDSSVHYIARYQAFRRRGQGLIDSIQATQRQVGRALVLANLALIAGFLVLLNSQFIPLVYFGVLVSAALLGGLIGNLILLPLLLKLVER